MGFLRNDNNFVKNQLVREAINHVSHELELDKKLVEQVFLSYFKILKKLVIGMVYERISLYGFGRMIRKPTAIEKAIKQLEYEEKLREQELSNRTEL